MSEEWSKSFKVFDEFLRSRFFPTQLAGSSAASGSVDDTPVPYRLLTSFYCENPDFERLIPISTFEAVFRTPGQRFAKYGDVIALAEEFEQIYADVDYLTDRADGHETIRWKKFVEIVTEYVRPIVNEIRGRLSDADTPNEEEIAKELESYREYVMDYVRFELLPETYAKRTDKRETYRTLLPIYEIVQSGVLDNLREPTRCDWINYDVFVKLRKCYDKLATKSARGGIETADGLAYNYSLSATVTLFTPAFYSALWAHVERIGWVRDGLLTFRNYVHVRRLLYYSNYKKGRRFLFDVLDNDVDGAIGHRDLVYFHRSLCEEYKKLDPERYFPNEKEAITSWLDQIAPDITPNVEWAPADRPAEQIYRVTFEDVANHKFGADFLLALISCNGFDKVECRYEFAAPEQDTEVDPKEASSTTTADELDTLPGSLETLVDEEDFANHPDLLEIDLED